MHIGLPSPSQNPGSGDQFRFEEESFEGDASETSSFAYDASHNTSTLPATQKQS